MNWDSYFHIMNSRDGGGCTLFDVVIDPSCEVYKGHFPGKPVSPGVCNIGMIRLCAEKAAGHSLRFTSIKQCRLTGLVTPSPSHILQVEVRLTGTEDGHTLLGAVIRDSEKTYMELKGELESA